MGVLRERDTGILTVVPTPIGNLRDITLRALDVLRTSDVIYAEDTRVTGKLLSALDIDGAALRRLDENTLANHTEEIVRLVAAGERVAYCTDAGMPGVSDPGLRLVAAVRAAELPVDVLPGPSAAVTAYVTSGITEGSFYFGGFLPRKANARLEMLQSVGSLDAALVFYESPKRLVVSLQAIAEVFPMRVVAVCRELTKMHEEVFRGTSVEVAREYASREAAGNPVRGEIAIVISAPTQQECESDLVRQMDASRDEAVRLIAEGNSPKAVAKLLTQQFHIARNDAYDIALDAKRRSQKTDDLGSDAAADVSGAPIAAENVMR